MTATADPIPGSGVDGADRSGGLDGSGKARGSAPSDRGEPTGGSERAGGFDGSGRSEGAVPSSPDEAAGTRPSTPDGAGRHDRVDGSRVWRFDLVERWLHWTMAVLVLVLIATGSILYLPVLSTWVGRRVLVKDVHVWSGLLLPLPWLLALPGARGRALRRDLGRLSRWYQDDSRWVRTRGRSTPAGGMRKFNAGQKLFTLLVGGALPVLLGTGLIMRWFDPFPDSIRNGATFVHDWTYLVLTVVVVGHILKAFAEPEALRSMRTGWVSAAWARTHRLRWWLESGGPDPRPEAGKPPNRAP